MVVHEARSRLDNLVTKSSTTTTPNSTQTLVSFPFFLLSFLFFPFFFSSSSLEFGPRPDELGTRVKPWRGPAPFEFVTPGIEQHRDRSDGTRYNSFSIPPAELNAAPEIAWPSGKEGGERFRCRDWMAIFKFYYTGEVESSRVVSPAYLVDLFISLFFSNFLFHEQTQILPLESLLESFSNHPRFISLVLFFL